MKQLNGARFLHFEKVTEKLLDKRIYRYLSLSDFEEMVSKNRIRFTNPAVWSEYDPFENLYFSLPFEEQHKTGKTSLDRLTKNHYAQCWTLSRESDSMWQIYRARYKRRGGVVKMRTTIRKLIDSQAHSKLYFGKVVYLTKARFVEEYQKFITQIGLDFMERKMSAGKVSEKLCFKRYPYRSEREVRFILGNYRAGKLPYVDEVHCRFDVNATIDMLVIDPRTDPKVCKKIKKDLEVIGFENKVIQSKLYTVKPEDFAINADPEYF